MSALPAIGLRLATLDDVDTLRSLIAASSRALASDDYSSQQIEAAIGSAWGVDTQLIRDATYFVARVDAEIVGCGGWSRRQTLFGADAQGGRDASLLVPGVDAAKVRAFFVRPDWARRGVGRAILERCETEAREAGFTETQLLATLPGVRLYAAMGYAGEHRVSYTLPGGVLIDFVPMRKRLA